MPQRKSEGTRATSAYDRDFFDDIGAGSLRSARVVVPMILELVGPVASVVDIGCGTGGWLRVFSEHGVADILGIDGDYIRPDQLEIPATSFRAMDLSVPISIDRRFDLVVCLEVAEHLSASASDGLVESLTKLSDAIVFSAAIPYQGGRQHVNEQWPEYWAEKFRHHGLIALDPFRSRIWSDDRVAPYFAQNMILYIALGSMSRRPGLGGLADAAGDAIPSLVHPGVYLPKARTAQRVVRLHESAPARWWRRLRRRTSPS